MSDEREAGRVAQGSAPWGWRSGPPSSRAQPFGLRSGERVRSRRHGALPCARSRPPRAPSAHEFHRQSSTDTVFA
jgi:hypothetical protein